MNETSSRSAGNRRSNDEGNLSDPLMLDPTASLSLNIYKQRGTTHVSGQEVKSKDASKSFSVKKELVPLKIVLFCWFGAISSVIPFMTIYFKNQGITASETAFIYSFFPLAKLFGPTLGGLVADKIGRYKPVLYTNLVLTIVFASSFLLIPSIPKCNKTVDILCWRKNMHEIPVRVCCSKTFCQNFHNYTEVQIFNCSLTCEGMRHSKGSAENQTETLCLNIEKSSICLEHNATSIEMSTPSESQIFYFCSSNGNSTNDTEGMCFPIYSKGCYEKCEVPDIDKTGQCEGNWNKRLPTLALTFAVFMGFHLFVAICFSLIETTAFAMVAKYKDDYGRQRFWSTLSMAIFSPLSGYLVDVLSKNREDADYSPVFYAFDVLILLNIIFLYVLDLPVAPPAKQIKKNVIQLLKSFEVIVFLFFVFLLGTFMGFFQSFLFWHLLDLGSPKYLLGLVITVGSLSSLPFLYTSKWFVERCGRTNLLITAFVFYFIKLFGYSYIYSPWWFVLFEAMEAFTMHLMWVAAATYAASISPKGLLATVQGSIAGIHFGIGRGSGTLIGGSLISAFGNRIAFRSMGISAGVVSVIYALLYWLYLRRREHGSQEVEGIDSKGRLRERNEEKSQNDSSLQAYRN